MIRSLASIGLLLALAALVLAGVPGPAAATPSLDACTGIVEPDATGHVLITQPGRWCLDRDHVAVVTPTARRYIRIQSDDVVLDCRSHRIVFSSGDDEPIAVEAYIRQRVAIRNCEFRGFWWAVTLDSQSANAGEFVVEDNVFRGNGRAINLNGADSIVRRNRIYDTVNEVALQVAYGRNTVADNLIDGVTGASMVVWLSDSVDFRGNTIRGVPAGDMFNMHRTIEVGTFLESPARPIWMRDNVLIGSPYAQGVQCQHPSVRLVDNVISGFAEATSACVDAGDNDVSP